MSETSVDELSALNNTATTLTPSSVPAVGVDPVVVSNARIGRRISRRSLILLAILWVVAGSVLTIDLWPERGPSPGHTVIPDPEVPAAREALVASLHFTQVTVPAGIRFVHTTGAYGLRFLPESLGGGAAFFDYDNDGSPDLLLVNGAYWPDHIPASGQPPLAYLYHNDGHGHFTDVTAGSGLNADLYGLGVAVGDYDNDGLPDILITGVGGCHLYHNEGSGKFKDVTLGAGVRGSPADLYTSAAFIDYDNDGRLDLFVCSYVKWDSESDKASNIFSTQTMKRRYLGPYHFDGTYCRLFHNDGNGHFTDVSKAADIPQRKKINNELTGKALGVSPVDLDGDGWIDFVVANDSAPNFAFRNQGDGTFKEIAVSAGLSVDSNGNTRANMGIDAAWFRTDGALGIAIGTFTAEATALYVSQNSPLLFADETVTAGIGPASRVAMKFGTLFCDFDLDGWEDLVTTAGHLDPAIHEDDTGQEYLQPAQLFWNSHGDGTFVRVLAEKCGKDIFQPIAGRGSAFADIDGDGDLDVIMTQVGGPPLLLRNDQHLGHHWLRLKLVGTTCNRDAIGAQIRVTVGGQTLIRQVMPTRSYLSQSELPVTIGLGNAKLPDRVEIIWPGGQKQAVTEPILDGLTRVVQDAPRL